MRRFVVAAVMAALCVPAAAAAPAGFYEAKSFEPAASYVARKPVKVYCATDIGAWGDYVAENALSSDAVGVARPGGAAARFDSVICIALDTYEGQPRTRQQDYVFAGSIETLTHEAIHLRGERDEGVTDCDAMHEMPGVAVRFFGVRPGARLRALMAQAWREHHAKSPLYQTVC